MMLSSLIYHFFSSLSLNSFRLSDNALHSGEKGADIIVAAFATGREQQDASARVNQYIAYRTSLLISQIKGGPEGAGGRV
jgi:hypothetical protein